ncbi:hypothetical protein AK812_SmicGene39617 [Symbiodinium microadriaticum]|uniref:Uncharacterized protein n=1 Tax=Symbiodinium microadriaticum TaxID=2951 RepID=A0A1Q9CAR0_SYMMI|nr:hypothetical protein AK812_SmicGene39617 [Symbiodinium microadriaticum]
MVTATFPPHSLTHALHVLQQLASGEGRPVPVQEAQLLLSLAAATNALPNNTLVHLPWAWGQFVFPDGYIPATAQSIAPRDVLLQPCAVFRSPPAFCKAQLRRAITVALQLARDASGANPSSQTRASPALARAWKVWLFLPRMLLFRPAQSPKVPKQQLLARFTTFFQGDWGSLSRAALDEAGAVGLHSASPSDDVARRAERAAHLARLGELSAARQALIAEPLAPTSDSTLRELTDPVRRPPHPYRPLPPELLDFQPEAPVALDRAAAHARAPHLCQADTLPKCSASFSMMKRRHLCLQMSRPSSPERRCLHLSLLQSPWDDLLLFASPLEAPGGLLWAIC